MKFTVKKENNKIFVGFDYNADVVKYVKSLKIHKWNPEGKNWEIGPDDLLKLKSKYKDAEFVDYKEPKPNTTLSKTFLDEIIKYKKIFLKEDAYKQSATLKPSNLHCERRNVYVLAGLPEDEVEQVYNYSECAKTGTMRHESIQDTLIRMTQKGSDFEYVDVGEYVKEQQSMGFCKELRVGDLKGAETHLYNDTLHLSFFCDGIVKYKPTGEYLLFEFKNKTSKKAAGCDMEFPKEHEEQVTAYCMCLNLKKVLLLVENRDTCELSIPPLYEVTDNMKQDLRKRLEYSIDCFNNKTIPAKPIDINCFFCTYKSRCKLVDEFGVNPLTQKEIKNDNS